ncbi:MAG: hypothetical protein L0177_01035 [Chloroflexi bacterium]|nr:hypothetical protein [Chloroflexota bacterium]
MGLVKVLDFGELWQKDTGLPLPLGVNVMRRDLGDAMHRALSQGLRDSIAWDIPTPQRNAVPVIPWRKCYVLVLHAKSQRIRRKRLTLRLRDSGGHKVRYERVSDGQKNDQNRYAPPNSAPHLDSPIEKSGRLYHRAP